MALPCALHRGLTEESLEIAVTAWKTHKFWPNSAFQWQGQQSDSPVICIKLQYDWWQHDECISQTSSSAASVRKLMTLGAFSAFLTPTCPTTVDRPWASVLRNFPSLQQGHFPAQNFHQRSKSSREANWNNSTSTRRIRMETTLQFSHSHLTVV